MKRLIILLLIVGCASFNQMATPSAKVIKDSFDGSVKVIQDNVSASASLSEGWHTLGFRWLKKYPNTVILSVGTSYNKY